MHMAAVGDEKIGFANFNTQLITIRRQQEQMYKQRGGELSPQMSSFLPAASNSRPRRSGN